MDREAYEKLSNEQCVARILAHWRKRGFGDIAVTSELASIEHETRIWVTRSNLIIPPAEKVSP